MNSLGIELGKVLQSGDKVTWDIFMSWNVLVPLIVIALLSLIPILLKKKKKQVEVLTKEEKE